VHIAEVTHVDDARRAARELSRALRQFQPVHPKWRPTVLSCGGLTGDGLDGAWQAAGECRRELDRDGGRKGRRSQQRGSWRWDEVRHQLMDAFLHDPEVSRLIPGAEEGVRSGETTATLAARRLLDSFTRGDRPSEGMPAGQEEGDEGPKG